MNSNNTLVFGVTKSTIQKILLMAVMAVFITLFGMSVNYSTQAYSNLTFSLDKSVYPSGNDSATVTNPGDANCVTEVEMAYAVASYS